MARGNSAPSPSKLLEAQLLIARSTAGNKKAKKLAAAKKAADKENKSTASGQKRSVAIAWSVKKNHHLSDSLLGIIEENPVYKVALGFFKGDVETVSSGGKKVIEHHQSIARKLFVNVEDSAWAEEHVKLLGESVKNRVTAMKKAYAKHRGNMSETGQGLLDAGKEDEIVTGSEIANIWDEVKRKFPWYMRMHALMGASPVVNRSAIANSTTPIDLSLLVRATDGQTSAGHDSPPWAIEDDDIELPHASSPRNSRAGSPNLDKTDEDDDDPDEADDDDEADDEDKNEDDGEPLKASTAVSAVPPTPSPSSAPRGQKRKSIADSIADVSARERDNRIKIAKINAAAKTQRLTEREHIKQRMHLEMEVVRLQHQRDEAAAQRAHEVMMFDRQFALEMARAGRTETPSLDAIHPSLR